MKLLEKLIANLPGKEKREREKKAKERARAEALLERWGRNEFSEAIANARDESAPLRDVLIRRGWYPKGENTFTRYIDDDGLTGILTAVLEENHRATVWHLNLKVIK